MKLLILATTLIAGPLFAGSSPWEPPAQVTVHAAADAHDSTILRVDYIGLAIPKSENIKLYWVKPTAAWTTSDHPATDAKKLEQFLAGRTFTLYTRHTDLNHTKQLPHVAHYGAFLIDTKTSQDLAFELIENGYALPFPSNITPPIPEKAADYGTRISKIIAKTVPGKPLPPSPPQK